MSFKKVIGSDYKIPRILFGSEGHASVRITPDKDGGFKVKHHQRIGMRTSRSILTFDAQGAMTIEHEYEGIFESSNNNFSQVSDHYRIFPYCQQMLEKGKLSQEDARKISGRIELTVQSCKAKTLGTLDSSPSR